MAIVLFNPLTFSRSAFNSRRSLSISTSCSSTLETSCWNRTTARATKYSNSFNAASIFLHPPKKMWVDVCGNRIASTARTRRVLAENHIPFRDDGTCLQLSARHMAAALALLKIPYLPCTAAPASAPAAAAAPDPREEIAQQMRAFWNAPVTPVIADPKLVEALRMGTKYHEKWRRQLREVQSVVNGASSSSEP